ncbi:MAG: hypothetical protein K2W96_07590 [Gemmataceae bacterium]|nr:hypothetical protein [Gemmataceae bacterium]
MNAREMQATKAGLDLEPAAPVLLNAWKHHAGALMARIERFAALGPSALAEAASGLVVVGDALMDLYTGTMSPRAVSLWVMAELERQGKAEPAVFASWLAGQGGYATITHPGDGTSWVLRQGDDPARWAHLHPGRHSPNTVRVQATVLKTAFLARLHARVSGSDPMAKETVDAVRRGHLGLPPLKAAPEPGSGLGAVIELLGG